MAKDLKYVGKRIPRYDGMQHVTGTTRYVNDIRLPGMLMVKGWRSPIPAANIKNIDISQAEKVKGVVKVLTCKDVPHNRWGATQDTPVLADTEIRYMGQDVVVVAAEDEDAALEALERVKVDLEPVEPNLDPLEAMKPGARKLDPKGNYVMFGEKNGVFIKKGNVDEAFKKADYIVENYYRTQAQEHCPIETQCGIAQTDSMGRTHIYSVMQDIFLQHGTIASILKVPLSKVHYIGGVVGGGFGAKNDLMMDHILAVLSLYTQGRPVKWVWTREEEFIASTHRAATHMWFKDGVTKDGHIIARQIKSVRDGGAYVLTNDYVVPKHAYGVAGPYHIPNVKVESYGILTNKRPTSSMRGFGLYQASFAYETQMEHIAEATGIDSWRLRFVNALREGEESHFMIEQHSVALIEVMQAAAKRAGIKLDDDLLAMSSAQPRKEA
jgi:CO/xanthine dehydrogenase Mo-binding subunit